MVLTVRCCDCRKTGLWNQQWANKNARLPAAEDAFRRAFRDDKDASVDADVRAKAKALREAIKAGKKLEAWQNAEVKQHSVLLCIAVACLDLT